MIDTHGAYGAFGEPSAFDRWDVASQLAKATAGVSLSYPPADAPIGLTTFPATDIGAHTIAAYWLSVAARLADGAGKKEAQDRLYKAASAHGAASGSIGAQAGAAFFGVGSSDSRKAILMDAAQTALSAGGQANLPSIVAIGSRLAGMTAAIVGDERNRRAARIAVAVLGGVLVLGTVGLLATKRSRRARREARKGAR